MNKPNRKWFKKGDKIFERDGGSEPLQICRVEDDCDGALISATPELFDAAILATGALSVIAALTGKKTFDRAFGAGAFKSTMRTIERLDASIKKAGGAYKAKGKQGHGV